MDKVIDYCVVTGDSIQDILIEVKMRITSMKNVGTNLSWVPQGGIFGLQDPEKYFQAMVLIEEDVKESYYDKKSDLQY